MVQDKLVATKISELMLDIGKRLDASILVVMENCSPQEFNAYRTIVGHLMADILLEILNPLYLQHPSLKPREPSFDEVLEMHRTAFSQPRASGFVLLRYVLHDSLVRHLCDVGVLSHHERPPRTRLIPA